MNDFKKKMKRRILGTILYIALAIIVIMISMNMKDRTFIIGVATAFIVMNLFDLFGYFKSLRSEKKLRELYITENDERSKEIRYKAADAVHHITQFILAIVYALTKSYNPMIAYTIVGVVIVQYILYNLMKFYYSKKI